METCTECQKEFDPSEGKFFEGRWFCRDCSIMVEKFETCFRCRRELAFWEYDFFQGHYYCKECYKAVKREWVLAHSCTGCNKELPLAGPVFTRPDGKKFCFECYKKQAPKFRPGFKTSVCVYCRACVADEEKELDFYEDLVICKKCFKEKLKGKMPQNCSACGHVILTKAFNVGRERLCSKCYGKRVGKELCAVCGKEIKYIKYVRPDGSLLCLDCSKRECIYA